MKLSKSVIYLLLFPLLLSAQSMQDVMAQGGLTGTVEMARMRQEQQKGTGARQLQTQAAQGLNILEGAVDASEYVLGPNDMLSIILWGELSTSWDIAVTAEGRVLLPNLGALFVSGKTLDEALLVINEEVAKKYKNVEVTVSLVLARTFKVHVTGNVAQPGTYITNANERVSQLIIMAGGLLPVSSRRNIIVKRNGSILKVDLEKFFAAGDKAVNPAVLDGDMILVPAQTDSISVWGEVASEGYYEFREGDDLADLIHIAGNPTSNALLSEVKVLRFESDNISTTEFIVDVGAIITGAESFELQADDRVFIRALPHYRQQGMVAVKGEVMYPGMYPFVKGETKITDIIAQAGGFTADANIYNATLQRNVWTNTRDSEYQRLSAVSVHGTGLEYDYVRTKSRETVGVASTNFYSLFEQGKTENDLFLQDKDVITIPRSSHTVTISGRVKSPGKVAYKSGKSINYYLKAAGGTGHGAKRGEIRVIKAGKGAWLKRGDVKELGVGDVIWVPEREEGYWWVKIKDVATISTQLLTLFLIIK